MARYLIGAGGWAYFQVPSEHPLVAYSKAFDFVEVNSTFYEIPNLKLVESWRRMVPPHFEFAVRCNKALTHGYRFQPTTEAFETMNKMTKICKILRAEILHMQTPPTFHPIERNTDLIDNFISSTDTKGIRVALEIRSHKLALNPHLIKIMQDNNMIHCIDLSKGEEPAYKSDILYTRLFGKGSHNIYQPTDEELKKIDVEASRASPKKVTVAVHFVRMYKDAGRLETYRQTGKFPMVTKSTGLGSLQEILEEDAELPSTREELIHHQGWKLIDLTEERRVHASSVLEELPEKTYNSINDVIETLRSVKSW